MYSACGIVSRLSQHHADGSWESPGSLRIQYAAQVKTGGCEVGPHEVGGARAGPRSGLGERV